MKGNIELLRPREPLRLVRDGEIGGSGFFFFIYLTPTGYTVTTRMTLHQGGQLCEPFYCFINCVGEVTRQCP